LLALLRFFFEPSPLFDCVCFLLSSVSLTGKLFFTLYYLSSSAAGPPPASSRLSPATSQYLLTTDGFYADALSAYLFFPLNATESNSPQIRSSERISPSFPLYVFHSCWSATFCYLAGDLMPFLCSQFPSVIPVPFSVLSLLLSAAMEGPFPIPPRSSLPLALDVGLNFSCSPTLSNEKSDVTLFPSCSKPVLTLKSTCRPLACSSLGFVCLVPLSFHSF